MEVNTDSMIRFIWKNVHSKTYVVTDDLFSLSIAILSSPIYQNTIGTKKTGYALYFNRTFTYEIYHYGYTSMRYTSTALYSYEENTQAPNKVFYVNKYF